MSEGRHIGFPKLSLGRDLPRWGLAAFAAVGAHAAVAAGAFTFAPVDTPPVASPVMTVELAPLAFSQAESVEQIETVAALEPEEVTEIEEEATTEEVVEETVEEEPVEEPEIVEEEIEEVEPPPVVKKAEVVLPKPVKKKKPKPEKEPKKVEKPVDKPKPRKLAQGRENPDAKASSQVSTRHSSAARPSAASVSNWNSKVRAAIARRKPRSVRGEGTVVINFVVSSSGAIVSSRVSRSSGDSTLDTTALAMARGSVPAPPSGHNGGPFTIPIRFE